MAGPVVRRRGSTVLMRTRPTQQWRMQTREGSPAPLTPHHCQRDAHKEGPEGGSPGEAAALTGTLGRVGKAVLQASGEKGGGVEDTMAEPRCWRAVPTRESYRRSSCPAPRGPTPCS